MKVFLSWSGDHAKKLAGLLMEWLPNVIQSVEPWTSEEIGKGTRWSDEIERALEESRFGILCLDQEHLTSPWIHFEAGAIAKSVQGATVRNRVTPLLLGVDEADLRDPLALFQATKLERDDMLRLVRSLNDVQDVPLDVPRLTKALEQWWPELESQVLDLEAKAKGATTTAVDMPADAVRAETEILEELLHLAREQRRAVARLAQDADGWPASGRREMIAPTEGIFQLRVDHAQRAIRKLALDDYRVLFESPEKMSLTLDEAPSEKTLKTLDAWAQNNSWEIRVETPDQIYYLGLSRFD